MQKTRCRNDALKDSIELLDEIKCVLQEVIEGENLTDSCRNHNLDYMRIRRFIMGTNRFYVDNRFTIDTCDIDFPVEDGYHRLYRKIFSLPAKQRINLPKDLRESIDFIIDTQLTPIQADILTNRFAVHGVEEAKTMKYLAYKHNIRESRVRDIEIKALRICRAGSNSSIIRDGMSKHLEDVSNKKFIAARKKAGEEQRAAAERKSIEEFYESYLNGLSNSEKEVWDAIMHNLNSRRIYDLDRDVLSSRAFNALKAIPSQYDDPDHYTQFPYDTHSYITLGELILLTDDKILSLHSCGKATTKEIGEAIESIIHEYGIPYTREEFLDAYKKYCEG
jgi:hypothetical protein